MSGGTMAAFRLALRLLRPSWALAIAAPLFMWLEVYTALSQPRLVRRVIDEGVMRGDMSVVLGTGATMVGLTGLGMTGALGCLLCSVAVVQRFGRDLRALLFRKVQRLSFRQLDRLQTGGLITRLTNDVTQIQDAVTMVLRHGVRIVTTLFGSMVMAALTSPRLAVIFLFLIPTVFGILSVVIRKAYPTYGRVQQQLDALNDVLKENTAGVRVIRAYVRELFEMGRFKRTNDALADQSVAAARLGATTVPLATLALNLGIVAVVWMGGRHVTQGTMQVGQVVAFITYLTQTLATLMMTSILAMQASRAQVSIRRVMELLQEPEETVAAVRSSSTSWIRGAIAFEDVSFSYDRAGRDPVLKNVSFELEAGQTLAVVGATGSGKSSLVGLVPGFYRPTSGRILMDGVDIATIDEVALRRAVAVVPQETLLFSGTVLENIRYGRPDASLEDVIAAAEAAQAAEFIRQMPEGFSTRIVRGGVNLSGGQRQRVAIARALLMCAPVLVLDDSTSALDVRTQARVQVALAAHERRQTRIIVAQSIEATRDADRIIVLEEGRLVGEGTYDELIASCSVFCAIRNSQTERVDPHASFGRLHAVS